MERVFYCILFDSAILMKHVLIFFYGWREENSEKCNDIPKINIAMNTGRVGKNSNIFQSQATGYSAQVVYH